MEDNTSRVRGLLQRMKNYASKQLITSPASTASAADTPTGLPLEVLQTVVVPGSSGG